MSRLGFRLEGTATHSNARAGRLTTLHNEVLTPVFMPVGTQATVKAQSFESLEQSGSQCLLANTYHLLLRPGTEVFRKFGGIHRFMNWKRSVLTDSGGFQIFSLPHSRKMEEEGAVFQSYVNGDVIRLTPETSIETQRAIGSDIMMVLDQCVPSTSERSVAENAMHLTHRWALRSLAARGDSLQSLFGIVQGACFRDLRKESAAFLTQQPFDGFAIGGLAVGESREAREDFTEFTAALLPPELPRYLMGVGTPIDILEAVHRGVDMFDCIIPTALAQRGVAFTWNGRVQLRRGAHRLTEEALDPSCACPTCRGFSKGYLHHLHKADEVLGWQLIGAHNLHFYHKLMAEIRKSILEGRFIEFYREHRERLNEPDAVASPRTVPRRAGDFEIRITPDGIAGVRHRSSGEVMHSVSDPIEEASRLYVEQSGLAEKLSTPSQSELVIWDVGLGAAANAMSAVQCFDRCQEKSAGVTHLRPLRLVSFESDLDSLRLALAHTDRFRYLKHPAPGGILERGEWTAGKLHWSLLQGDFLSTMISAPAPDLIFFDPFSSQVNPELWTLSCFKKIAECCGSKETLLFTYSNSTAIRAGLLAAGFFVAEGIGTGPKRDTTIAFHAAPKDSSVRLLSTDWLSRWNRSSARFPSDAADSESLRNSVEKLVQGHPQFLLSPRLTGVSE